MSEAPADGDSQREGRPVLSRIYDFEEGLDLLDIDRSPVSITEQVVADIGKALASFGIKETLEKQQ